MHGNTGSGTRGGGASSVGGVTGNTGAYSLELELPEEPVGARAWEILHALLQRAALRVKRRQSYLESRLVERAITL